MSAPRLTFLYPHLFHRPFAVTGRSSGGLRGTRQHSKQLSRTLHTTNLRPYDIQPTSSYAPQDRAIPLPQPGEGRSQSASGEQDGDQADNKGGGNRDEDGGSNGEEGGHEGDIIDVAPRSSRAEMDARESHPAEPVPELSLQLSSRPLERVLHMEPPTSRDGDGSRPHLRAAPYVHHFDTFSLVHDLQTGGFTQQQSISLMKAVRGLLANNMQLAREDLVNKSDNENASYLFSAACSELKTEVENGRRSAADKIRSERAHIQHEVDILGQRVAQETAALKEELKGVFDDRKMAVRMEQREMESKIQELNYKIQSLLGSKAKSEVEGLRWDLTRRAAIFIGGLAVAVVVGIQYSVHASNTRKEEKKAKEAELSRPPNELVTTSYTNAHRSAGTQTSDSTDALLSSMDAKTSQNYVSLG